MMPFRTGLGTGTPPFTPLSIPGCSLWLDVTDPATIFQDNTATTPALLGNKVGYWKDKSGNNRHVQNGGSSANWPTYTDQVGEPDSLFFNAIGQALAYNPGGANVPCATAFCVARFSTGNDAFAGLVTNAGDGATGVDYIWTRDNLTTNFEQTQAAGGALANSTHMWNNRVLTSSYSNLSKCVFAADGTGHPGPLTLANGVMLGSDRGISNRDFFGSMWEVILYDTILSPADRARVEAYLGNKHSITLP